MRTSQQSIPPTSSDGGAVLQRQIVGPRYARLQQGGCAWHLVDAALRRICNWMRSTSPICRDPEGRLPGRRNRRSDRACGRYVWVSTLTYVEPSADRRQRQRGHDDLDDHQRAAHRISASTWIIARAAMQTGMQQICPHPGSRLRSDSGCLFPWNTIPNGRRRIRASASTFRAAFKIVVLGIIFDQPKTGELRKPKDELKPCPRRSKCNAALVSATTAGTTGAHQPQCGFASTEDRCNTHDRGPAMGDRFLSLRGSVAREVCAGRS